jgi:hypothetical protein
MYERFLIRFSVPVDDGIADKPFMILYPQQVVPVVGSTLCYNAGHWSIFLQKYLIMMKIWVGTEKIRSGRSIFAAMVEYLKP